MKTIYLFLILFLFLFLLRATTSFAQGDIVKDSIRIEGIYLTFNEFRNNAPSLRGRVLVLDSEIKLYDSATRRFKSLEERFWGACSNNFVYVAYRISANARHRPCLLKSIGRYCFFIGLTEIRTNRDIYGGDIAASPYKVGDFVIDINDGVNFKLSDKLVKTILKPDPELFGLFEKDRERRKNYKKYILEYNSKHKDEIVPISH